MTITALVDHDEPEHGRTNPAVEMQASAALAPLLRDHPAVAGELEETVRAHIHFQELVERARQAASAATAAQQRAASLTAKLDPASHRILGFTAGAVLVAVLITLDAVPLNWAGQAFGLDAAGTWLVTGLLLVASIGAMLGFEVTRTDPRRRGTLAAVVAAAYVALLVLRTEFLTTVAAESLSAAVLQAVLLTAISAGLVLCGSAIMARTRQLSLARARAAARRARHAAVASQAAQRQAAEKMKRHLGGLYQILLPWVLVSDAPTGIDHGAWAAAMKRAIHALFPGL
jgi:hypothetical protein